MTRDDIIRMAREAGIGLVEGASLVYFQMSDLEHFAALVAAAEREECAKVCDAIEDECRGVRGPYLHLAAKDCAIAIRARSNTTGCGTQCHSDI